MEDILGGRGDPARFDRYLADWQAILARRTNEAIASVVSVEGVRGIILAGGVGRGQPWPLSDIDLLMIYADDLIDEARAEVERRRVSLLDPWIEQGWWTGLDVGKLAFTTAEVTELISLEPARALSRFDDDRLYHSLDKGYQGRAMFDPAGLTGPFSEWLTIHRFDPAVVRLRLERERREIVQTLARLRQSLERGDRLAATTALRAAAHWTRILLLERWGQRDASQARVGSRFDTLAKTHGQPAVSEQLNALCDLDAASVRRRMQVAPDWVWERHDRSWKARRHLGEPITPQEDRRDVLRVCTLYGARAVAAPPYPAWLAIPERDDRLIERASHLQALIDELDSRDSDERP